MLMAIETEKAKDLIAQMRRRSDAKAVKQLIKAAKAFKPSDVNGMSFDKCVEVLRANYCRSQSPRAREKLIERYKRVGSRMPIFVLNITRETAELQAQAYRREPLRQLLVDGLDPLDPEGSAAPNHVARAESFRELVKLAKLKTIMLEAERISGIAGSVFTKTRWSMAEGRHGRKERPEVTLFWPSQVDAIPSASAPSKLWAAHAVILHLRDPSSGTGIKEIWTRDEVRAAPANEESFAAQDGWWYGRYTEDGEEVLASRPFELADDLPINRITHQLEQGRVFPEPKWDLVTLQDEVNIMMSDDSHRMSYQSHTQGAVAGGDIPKNLAFGPDTLLELPQEARLTTIPATYDSKQLDGIERKVKMFAHTERLPVDAFYMKEGNPETGAARESRNEHADQRRMEHVAQLEDDEQEFCRTLARVADKWGDLEEVIDGDDAEYRTKFRPPRTIEDRAQKQQRLERDLELGIISPARYAVEMDHFVDEEAAEKEGGLSRKPKSKAPPAPFDAPPREEPADDAAEAS